MFLVISGVGKNSHEGSASVQHAPTPVLLVYVVVEVGLPVEPVEK